MRERYTYMNNWNTKECKRVQQYKVLTSLLKKLERYKGVRKDGAPKGRLEVHATAALLWTVTGRIDTLRAPWPEREVQGSQWHSPGEYNTIPSGETGRAQVCKWYQVRSTQETDRLEQEMNRYNMIIIKQENRKSDMKLIISKSDFIRLGHAPMRLVHRRNNPNKETLIYIPFVSCHRISKRIESEMQIMLYISNSQGP